MGRKSASGSGIRDEQPGSYFLELRNHFLVFLGLKYLNSLMRIQDPGWRQFGSGIRYEKKSDPGSGINIPDPQHCCSPLARRVQVPVHPVRIQRLLEPHPAPARQVRPRGRGCSRKSTLSSVSRNAIFRETNFDLKSLL